MPEISSPLTTSQPDSVTDLWSREDPKTWTDEEIRKIISENRKLREAHLAAEAQGKRAPSTKKPSAPKVAAEQIDLKTLGLDFGDGD